MKVKIALYPYLYFTLRHFVAGVYNAVEHILDKRVEMNLYKESFTLHRFFRTMTLTQEHTWKCRNKNKEYDFAIDVDIAMTIYELLQKKELTSAELVLQMRIHQTLVSNNISPLILALT